MASEIGNALDFLTSSVNRLNGLTDEATAAVIRVEDRLGELNVGIGASIPFGIRKKSPPNLPVPSAYSLSQLVDPVIHEQRRLEYGRTGKDRQFRIFVRDHNGSEIAWSALPRDLKIEAVAALPELVTSIATQVQTRLQAAESALNDVWTVLPPEMSKGGAPQ